MIVIDKNEGKKIPYSVLPDDKSVCFDDDLTINLAKREKDWDEHIDVCFDYEGNLVIGAAAGRLYVAELDIPARRYTTEYVPDPEGGQDQEILKPVPFDIDLVTLSLWAIEEA